MATDPVTGAVNDPDFWEKVSPEDRRTVLSTLDPDFKGMAAPEQDKVLGFYKSRYDATVTLPGSRKDLGGGRYQFERFTAPGVPAPNLPPGLPAPDGIPAPPAKPLNPGFFAAAQRGGAQVDANLRAQADRGADFVKDFVDRNITGTKGADFSQPIMDFTKLVAPEQPGEAPLTSGVRAAAEAASSLTSRESVLLAAGTAGISGVPVIGKAVQSGLAAYFAAHATVSAGKNVIAAKQAFDAGDYNEMARQFGYGSVNALMAAMTTRSGLINSEGSIGDIRDAINSRKARIPKSRQIEAPTAGTGTPDAGEAPPAAPASGAEGPGPAAPPAAPGDSQLDPIIKAIEGQIGAPGEAIQPPPGTALHPEERNLRTLLDQSKLPEDQKQTYREELIRQFYGEKALAAAKGGSAAAAPPAEAGAVPAPEASAPGAAPTAPEVDPANDDATYQKAIELIRQKGVMSTSVLQRGLKLGYGAANRILDRMRAEGIDPTGRTPIESSDPRRAETPAAPQAVPASAQPGAPEPDWWNQVVEHSAKSNTSPPVWEDVRNGWASRLGNDGFHQTLKDYAFDYADDRADAHWDRMSAQDAAKAEAPAADAPPEPEAQTGIERRKPIEIKVQDENGGISTTPVTADVVGDLAIHDRIDGYGYSVTHVPSGLSINVGTHAQAESIMRRIHESGIDLSTEHISDDAAAKIKQIIDDVLPSGESAGNDQLQAEPEHGHAPEIVKDSPYDTPENTSPAARQSVWDTVAEAQTRAFDWLAKTHELVDNAAEDQTPKEQKQLERTKESLISERKTYEDGWSELANAFGSEAAGKLREQIEGDRKLPAPVVPPPAEKPEKKPVTPQIPNQPGTKYVLPPFASGKQPKATSPAVKATDKQVHKLPVNVTVKDGKVTAEVRYQLKPIASIDFDVAEWPTNHANPNYPQQKFIESKLAGTDIGKALDAVGDKEESINDNTQNRLVGSIHSAIKKALTAGAAKPAGASDAHVAASESVPVQPPFSQQMREAKTANDGRTILANFDNHFGDLEKAAGLPPTIGLLGSGFGARGGSTLKPKEWKQAIAKAFLKNPIIGSRLKAMAEDYPEITKAWERLYAQESAESDARYEASRPKNEPTPIKPAALKAPTDAARAALMRWMKPLDDGNKWDQLTPEKVAERFPTNLLADLEQSGHIGVFPGATPHYGVTARGTDWLKERTPKAAHVEAKPELPDFITANPAEGVQYQTRVFPKKSELVAALKPYQHLGQWEIDTSNGLKGYSARVLAEPTAKPEAAVGPEVTPLQMQILKAMGRKAHAEDMLVILSETDAGEGEAGYKIANAALAKLIQQGYVEATGEGLQNEWFRRTKLQLPKAEGKSKNVPPATKPVRADDTKPLGETSSGDGEGAAGIGQAPAGDSTDGGNGIGSGTAVTPESGPEHGAKERDPETDVAEPTRQPVRRPRPPDTRPALTGYRITAADRLGEGSLTDKANQNVEAIKLMKLIEGEARPATPEEQRILVKYTGWGAITEPFEGYQHSPAMRAVRSELQGLLTTPEWKSVAATTPNAHYTSETAIQGIWSAVERLGIKAGASILEPSMGVGHFFGLMPGALIPNAKLAGVEIDPITARIAALLYPNAGTYPTGFEETRFPNNWFDLAIGNVPFGNYGVHDPAFKGDRRELLGSIHNYFFAKALDKVRPGGIIAFITSKYTMDTKSSSVREYIAKEAKLLGAIRLPQTAFEKNAGTTVVTDVIFLQKRVPGDASEGESWLTAAPSDLFPGDQDNPSLNEYYKKHPEMVLGTITGGRGRFGPELRVLGELTPEKLAGAIARLPANVVTEYKPSEAFDADKIAIAEYPEASAIKQGGFGIHEGKIVRREGEFLTPITLAKETAARVKGIIGVRDAVRDVFRTQIQDAPDKEIDAARKALGKVYDQFVGKFGPMHDKANASAFREDPDAPLLLALEKLDPETKKVAKTDIFSKRTVQSYRPVATAENAKEAMTISLNEYGRINWIRMAQLTGRDAEDLQDELGDLIYRDENKNWLPADEYLSGDIRQKLVLTKELAKTDPSYERNVTALEAAKPPDLVAGEIVARLGAPWIPPVVIRKFVADLLGIAMDSVSVAYAAPIATWRLVLLAGKATAKNTSEWAGGDVSAAELIEMAMNMKVPTVRVPVGDGDKTVVEPKKTAAAQDMQQKLKDRFKLWVWEDPIRSAGLEKLYNDTYNGIRLREYDGSHLTLNGANPAITLRAHQKNAIWRTLTSGRNTLLAHVVGAGKTFEMIGAAMELRRLGLAKKPMLTVPANIVNQIGKDFRLLYPAANILVADENTFSSKNRQKAMAQVATGNWDAVVISHDAFGLLPVADETFNTFLQKEIDTLEDAIRESKAGQADKKIQKELEKAKKRLEAKLRDKADRENKDNVLTFEELGVDALFVDEADKFKNLYFVTRATRIAGIPNSESNRAFDMLIKSRHVTDKTGGRLVFATGTPIANTVAEMYTMLRYLSHKELESRGLGQFDAWAQQFGESVTGLETSPDGAGFRQNTRFAKFSNLPELQSLFRQVADVQTAEMLNLPVPKLFGGKHETISVKASQQLLDYIMAKDEHGSFLPGTLMRRIANIKGGNVDPKEDNMLKVTSDGRKAALDLRLIGYSVDLPDSKVNVAVNRIHEIWKAGADKLTTQMVFSDLSTPNKDRWNVYDEIRRKLTLKGVPAAEIAYAHDADTDAKKAILFAAVNAGKIRVLIGSTEKMGAGTNAQRRLIALHHLDVPWRPRDVEQREGRIIRQGNTNPEVHVIRYVTAPSFDAYMWGLVSRKAKFINQVITGKLGLREAEDVGQDSLGAAEAEAAATGNPLIKEKADIDNQVMRLSALQSEHARKQITARIERDRMNANVERANIFIPRLEADIATRDANSPKDFTMKVNGQTFTKREDAGNALHKFAIDRRMDEEITPAGTYRGFELRVQGRGAERLVDALWHSQDSKEDLNVPKLSFHGAATHYANLSPVLPRPSGTGTVQSLDHELKNLNLHLEEARKQLATAEANRKQYNITASTPFPDGALLDKLVQRQQEIIKLLDLGANQAPPATDDTTASSYIDDEDDDDTPPRLRSDAGVLSGAALKPIGKLADAAVRPLLEFRDDIRLVFFPTRLSFSADVAGLSLREQAARVAQTQLQVQEATKKIRAYFAQQPKHVIYDFIARMEHGKPQADPYLDTVARVLREWMDKYRDDVQALGDGKLTKFYENYFPHIWKNPKQAEVTIASLLGRRPIEGKKAFLKKRKHVYFSDAMDAGLVPVSHNPVDLVLLKLHEMGRYILAHRWLNEMKALRLAKYIGERMRKRVPQGWTEIPDPIGTVYGAPTIPMVEGLDREMWQGLLQIADALDIDHQRVAALRKQWGNASIDAKGQARIRTRRGGPESVLIHEIGHHLDWKYGIAKQLVGTMLDPSPYDEELRKLADLRLTGKDSAYFKNTYIRKGTEKIANMIAAYVHARDLFEQTAPKTFAWWEEFIFEHPELKPIQDVRYGMQIETLHYELDHGGTLIRGRYYMPKSATQIIKNYLSPGIAYKSYYQIFRQASNMMLQFSLGFSGFHAGFVTFESMVSKTALAIRYAVDGKPVKAIQAAMRVPLAPIENVQLGSKILGELVLPGFADPEIVKYAEYLVMAGGRVAQDDIYRTKFREKVGDAIRAAFAEAKINDKIGQLGRAAVFTAPAIAEMAAWPVLEWLVPRIKAGTFAQMARFEIERLGPEAEREDIRAALADAWDSVDNRYGQLVYDNLFWNKIAKDIAMVSVQSVGWNVGTFREILGGVLDIGRAGGQIGMGIIAGGAGGRGGVPPGGSIPGAPSVPPPSSPGGSPFKPEFTHRMAYILALPIMTAVIGGIINYINTHDDKKTHGLPQSWKDLFWPRTGRYNDTGDPERLALPSYVNDVYHWRTHPQQAFLNKLSPIVRLVAEELTNKDWQNKQIADPNDPMLIRWKKHGLHAAGFFRPIVTQNIGQSIKDGDSPAMIAAPLIGIRKAPSYIDRTPAQLMMADKFAAAAGNQPTAEETYDRTRARREIAHLLRTGKLDEARKLARADVAAGTINRADVGRAAKSSIKDGFVAQFHALPLESQLDVWRVSSDEEKKKEVREVLLKLLNVRDRSPEELRAIRAHYADVFKEIRSKFKRAA